MLDLLEVNVIKELSEENIHEDKRCLESFGEKTIK